MTVATWIAAYLTLLPLVHAPSWVTICSMIAVVFAGGFLAARFSIRGFLAAPLAGTVSGLIDMLLIGSIIRDVTGGSPTPAIIALWCAGSILGGAIVASLGGILGSF